MPMVNEIQRGSSFSVEKARESVFKGNLILTMDVIPRSTIGAANPYCLAGILQKPSNVMWFRPGISPTLTNTFTGTVTAVPPTGTVSSTVKKSVKYQTKQFAYSFNPNVEILAKYLHLQYWKLFDPVWGSPLYSPFVISLARGQLPGPNVQGAPPVPAQTPDHWGVPPNGINWNTTAMRASTVDDPIQGPLPNCYLHAALVALSFSQNYYATFLSMGQTSTPVQITMWDENTHVTGGQKDINNEILLSATNQPAFAQSSPVTSWNIGGEIWPGIYEKAYGYFKKFPKSPINKSDRFNPPSNYDPNKVLPDDYVDISYYWTFQNGGGNPLNVLVNLTNKSYTYGTSYFLTRNQIEADIFTKIKNQCKMTGLNGVPWQPMVSWTYLSGTVAPDPKPIYQDEVIVANHAYAVLGVTTYSNIKYIILRNPWGMLYGVNPDPVSTLAQDVSLQAADVWYTQTWQAVAGFSRPMTYNDGIFGLKISAFKKYFEGYGWVQ